VLVILARDKRSLFWPLHRQFVDDGIEVIVDRRHGERRREPRTPTVDRRYGDRRAESIEEDLRARGWSVVGEGGTLRPRVEWIVERATMRHSSQ